MAVRMFSNRCHDHISASSARSMPLPEMTQPVSVHGSGRAVGQSLDLIAFEQSALSRGVAIPADINLGRVSIMGTCFLS